MLNPSAGFDSEAEPTLLAPAELNPEDWDRAARRLLAKMLSAFAYEEIIEPVVRTGGRCTLTLDDDLPLTFHARRGAYGHWHIDPDTIALQGEPFSDPLRFLVLARRLLALDGATLGHLVRELTTTLAADARIDHTALPAAELAELDYAQLEGHQTGHPWLVLNKGRIGFSAADAARWTPESRFYPPDCRGSRSARNSRSTGASPASRHPTGSTAASSTPQSGSPSPPS